MFSCWAYFSSLKLFAYFLAFSLFHTGKAGDVFQANEMKLHIANDILPFLLQEG